MGESAGARVVGLGLVSYTHRPPPAAARFHGTVALTTEASRPAVRMFQCISEKNRSRKSRAGFGRAKGCDGWRLLMEQQSSVRRLMHLRQSRIRVIHIQRLSLEVLSVESDVLIDERGDKVCRKTMVQAEVSAMVG